MARAPQSTHQETRDAQKRDTDDRDHAVREWTPPELLPEVPKMPGWRTKWVRSATLGKLDTGNVSKALREGWQMVKLEDVPEFAATLVMDVDGRFASEGNVEVGGLVLCKIPEEVAAQRDAYYAKRAGDQERAVNRQFHSQSDPRVPLKELERSSKTSFGNGGS